MLPPEGGGFGREVLAADDHEARAVRGLRRRKLAAEHLEMRRCQLDQAEVGTGAQALHQAVDARGLVDQRYRLTGRKRHQQARDGQVEAQR